MTDSDSTLTPPIQTPFTEAVGEMAESDSDSLFKLQGDQLHSSQPKISNSISDATAQIRMQNKDLERSSTLKDSYWENESLKKVEAEVLGYIVEPQRIDLMKMYSLF